GDVADLTGQISGHEIHVVGEIAPRAGEVPDIGLPAEPPFRSHLAGHTGHFGGEQAELINHRVDGVFEPQNLSPHVHGDLLRQVPVRDGLGHVGNIADLAGEIAGHEVHAVGQVLPGARDPLDFRLAPELPLRADFARHASYFGSERAEL